MEDATSLTTGMMFAGGSVFAPFSEPAAPPVEDPAGLEEDEELPASPSAFSGGMDMKPVPLASSMFLTTACTVASIFASRSVEVATGSGDGADQPHMSAATEFTT